ncbi:PhoU domain-containing protein [uncultured Helicobacter sp.]|uniref:phosphate signaling complex PhoU family protein n=1 Tax=uncultured Helicobacter sp. TaxID=175537 RepID=UPI002634D6EF|nr:PhoU domain-containing protein [uncultured Helicobacter sp.]
MRDVYTAQLNALNAQCNIMLSLSEDSLAYACFGDSKMDIKEIEFIVEQLNGLEKDIFHACEMIILKQQPVAQHLESITRIIRQILDLRRIGEISLNSARIIVDMPQAYRFSLLGKMANLLYEMFSAFRENHMQRVKELEDIIDSCFRQVKAQIAQNIQNSYQDAHWWLEILMLSKYFEKIADHISAMTYA